VQFIASEEQKKKWIPMVRNLKMIGCYAQTELGHGSNVAALETTATFDPETDEFVIHSPTTTSTKYWPGDLGRFASHAIVMARLIVGDQDYGTTPFMVQLRDVDTWKHMPGVQSGDIGPKIGYHSKDNGWASFNKVRIPRTDMLMGLTSLDREGNFEIAGDLRALYTIMMMIRVTIVYKGNSAIGMAATIATRYSAIRRQFKTIEGSKEERSLLDYQTQQYKLAPMIALCYIQTTVGHYCNEGFVELMKGMDNGEFDRLDVMHHLLAGYKAIFSDRIVAMVEIARKSCGGAGYSAWSGFPNLFFNTSPVPTYEGDNTVMLL